MECGVELQGVDLHAAGVITETDPIGFGTMDDAAETLGVAEREMWLNSTDQDDLLGVNDVDASSMFYADFPPLPDFPCMSSSSSSSSTPSALPMKTTMACTSTTTITTTTSSNNNSPSASSSSAASWAVLKSDAEEDAAAAAERINNRCNQQQGYNMHQQQHHQHDLVMDHHHHHHAGALSSTASMEIMSQHQPGLSNVNVGDCMDDVMDTFGYMELLEANDFFDPASIFQSEEENQNPLVEFTQEDQKVPQQQQQHQHAMEEYTTPQQVTEEDHGVNLLCGDTNAIANNNNNEEENIQGDGVGADDEMSMVFLEWLKSNKDSVSANDLRNVKLKKSTIESAARRLGGGKEAMKQLLKLILEWVQTSHLQNKRRKENHNNNSNTLSNLLPQQQFQDQNGANVNQPISSFGPESNTCTFNQTVPWPPSFGADQSTPFLVAPPVPFSQPMVGYVSDSYNTSNNMNATHNHNPYQQPAAAAEYQMLETAHSWAPSQYTVASHYNQSFGEHNSNLLQPVPAFGSGGYAGNQYPYHHQFFHGPGGGGDRLMRLGPSATKEARKKRMARQRRFMSHHHRHHNNHHQNIQGSDPHASARLGDNCTTTIVAAAPPPHAANPANWMYWQTMAGGAAPMAPVVPAEPPRQPVAVDRPAMQTAQNCHQGRVASDRRQVGGTLI